MKLREIIGINLKFYRYKSGLSQEKYYAKHNLSVKYLSCCERSKINLTCDNIDDIAHALGIKTEDLITYDKNKIITQKRVDQKIMN